MRRSQAQSRHVLKLLRAFESQNVTFIAADGSWPIVWDHARGNYVWDVDGRRYVDLTAAFGVAAAGHANGRVVRAAKAQMAKLMHAMGDVHPHALKAELARELSRITFERWQRGQRGKTIFCNSGFEAVESALKTALLATGKRGVVSFAGGYHGLGYGALAVTHRELFRAPFLSQLPTFGKFLPYPTTRPQFSSVVREIRKAFRAHAIGAVLVEPVQGRGGINVPVPEFLPFLRDVCDRNGSLLIVDEVFTGFGRTGRWFGCEHFGVTPDIICLGKALTGGFPLSACVGEAELMDTAWPPSQGEALHTSTFLGHPVGCAMALANIAELRSKNLVRTSERLGSYLLQRLQSLRGSNLSLSPRGLGLMAGVELRKRDGAPATGDVWQIINDMLRRGFIMLPEGEHGNVLSFTPPLTITRQLLDAVVRNLSEVLQTL